MKYFVYKQNHEDPNTYWSAQKGWVKYELATIYSQEEVDKIEQLGGMGDWNNINCRWVLHEPPKPTPVIVGDGSTKCELSGYYWVKPPDQNSYTLHKTVGSIFARFHLYVYIPEPNWPA